MLSCMLVSLLISTVSWGLDVVEPEALCERFLGDSEKVACQKFMKEKKPDTYVSSVCQDTFDDKKFYQCMEIAAAHALDPRKIEICNADGNSDDSRIQCLRKIAQQALGSSHRQPANIQNKPRVKQKLDSSPSH